MSLFPECNGLNKNHRDGMELGSVTLKRIGFFCFPIKHSTHTTPESGLRPRNSGLKGPHTYAQPFLTSNGTWPTSLKAHVIMLLSWPLWYHDALFPFRLTWCCAKHNFILGTAVINTQHAPLHHPQQDPTQCWYLHLKCVLSLVHCT